MKEYTFNIDALEALAKEAARQGNNQVISLIDSIFLGGGLIAAQPVVGGAAALARKAIISPGISTGIGQMIQKGALTKGGAAIKAIYPTLTE